PAERHQPTYRQWQIQRALPAQGGQRTAAVDGYLGGGWLHLLVHDRGGGLPRAAEHPHRGGRDYVGHQREHADALADRAHRDPDSDEYRDLDTYRDTHPGHPHPKPHADRHSYRADANTERHAHPGTSYGPRAG